MKRLLSSAVLTGILIAGLAPDAFAQYNSAGTSTSSLWSRLVSRVKPSNPYPEYSLPAYLGLRDGSLFSALKWIVRFSGSRTIGETRLY